MSYMLKLASDMEYPIVIINQSITFHLVDPFLKLPCPWLRLAWSTKVILSWMQL